MWCHFTQRSCLRDGKIGPLHDFWRAHRIGEPRSPIHLLPISLSYLICNNVKIVLFRLFFHDCTGRNKSATSVF